MFFDFFCFSNLVDYGQSTSPPPVAITISLYSFSFLIIFCSKCLEYINLSNILYYNFLNYYQPLFYTY